MSAKRRATAQSGKSALKKQAGRPAKKHCIDDAVRMVSALFEKRGLNVRHFLLGDCINVFQSSCRINFFLLSICTGNSLQVIDKDLLYDEAIWACRLFDTVTRQTLRYHVRKELERRMMQKQEENGKVGKSGEN